MAPPRVLVIGAGPGGLATAACLQPFDVEAEVVDRHGTRGGAYTRAYPGVTLASPARFDALPGLALECEREYVTIAEYASYLRAYASRYVTSVRQATVSAVERTPTGFRVRFAGPDAEEDYRYVVVATGMFDFPKWPAIAGLAPGVNAVHASAWRGPQGLEGGSVLIIGGATSAIEIAEECARAGIRAVVSVRGKDVKISPQRILGRDIHDFLTLIEWLPRGLMKSYCAGQMTLPGTDLGFRAFRREGRVEVCGAVDRIEERSAVFSDGTTRAFDSIVCATGYRFATPFLPDEARAADRCESRKWPGLFLIGLPCARGLNSEFLRGIARDAPVIARRIGEARA